METEVEGLSSMSNEEVIRCRGIVWVVGTVGEIVLVPWVMVGLFLRCGG